MAAIQRGGAQKMVTRRSISIEEEEKPNILIEDGLVTRPIVDDPATVPLFVKKKSYASACQRPGQRAAAFKEQVTGIKDKVYGILRSAVREQALTPPPKQSPETSTVKREPDEATPPKRFCISPPSNLQTEARKSPFSNYVHPPPIYSSATHHQQSTKIMAAPGIRGAPNIESDPLPQKLTLHKPIYTSYSSYSNVYGMDRYLQQTRMSESRNATRPSTSTTLPPQLRFKRPYDSNEPIKLPSMRVKKMLPSNVKSEAVKMELKGILRNKDLRVCGAYVSKHCQPGPFISKDRFAKLKNYEPRHYAQLQLAIVQDLINCAYIQKDVFDQVPGTTVGPSLKVLCDHNSNLLSKEIPLHLSPATMWTYIHDFLVTINACPNLFKPYDSTCTSCPKPSSSKEVDMVPANAILYNNEHDTLKKLGAKLPTKEEIAQKFRERLGDEVAELIIKNDIDSSVLPYCQVDIIRDCMNVSHAMARRIVAYTYELRAEAFESVDGIDKMNLKKL